MHKYQREFLDFALASGVLRFGAFQLKSGRTSPYFFDTGRIASGGGLARLGRFYASAVVAAGIAFDALFGPAYKGIPLAVATGISLAADHDRDLPVTFDRKEAKDHGEGGKLLGSPLAGAVLIVDDVITAGTSVRESVALIRAEGARPAGVAIAFDRQERGQEGASATDEVRRLYGIPVISIVTLADLIEHLETHGPASLSDSLRAVADYRASYGV